MNIDFGVEGHAFMRCFHGDLSEPALLTPLLRDQLHSR
jgi:hypothetical protein